MKQKAKSFKSEFKEPTPVKKLKADTKTDRMNKLKQLRTNKLNTTILQRKGIIDKDGESTIQSINATNLTALIDQTEYIKTPILCTLIGLNEEANVKKVALDLFSFFEKDKVSVRLNQNLFTGIVPLDIVKGKERVTIICAERNILNCLDLCKVSDLVIFVSSCKTKINYNQINLDANLAIDVMDAKGYEIISAINSQGLIPHICITQDLESIEEKHKNTVKKLFQRYFESELKPLKIIDIKAKNNNIDSFELNTEKKKDTNEEEYFGTDDYKTLIRTISHAKTYTETLNIRKHRSYMLVDNYYPEPNKKDKNKTNLVVEGYIKGNTLVNFDYVHLTGYGDFIALEVNDEIDDPCPITYQKKQNKHKQSMDTTMGKHDMTINIENNVNKDDLLNNNPDITGKPGIIDDDFKRNKLLREEKKKVNNMIDAEIDELIDFNLDPKEEDISFHDEDEEQLIKEQEAIHYGLSKKHEAKTSLYYRTPDDMEVADEIDTPINIPCRELFSKYRGLNSMATGSLNPSINLPKEYSNIYSFENIRHTFKECVKSCHEKGQRCSGKYVRITLKNFNDFHLLDKNKPLILSTLLNHERKLCVMHLKIKLNENYEGEEIYSKQLIEAQIGFRRNLCRPIYSQQVGETDKLKKERKLAKGKITIATIYAQLTYPETPVMIFRPHMDNDEMNQIAIGKTIISDCNKILIKRSVLTGYPLKIHKKRSVVRYMFFNPEDVNFFKPIPLFTKHGLRGNIIESLGTHGHMKCAFNDNPKPNDTICLPLYKRIFPVWFPETWRLPLGFSDSKKYYDVFRNDTTEFNTKEQERYKIVDVDDEKINNETNKNQSQNINNINNMNLDN
jgi:pre-rRNA-processing protein TSR1